MSNSCSCLIPTVIAIVMSGLFVAALVVVIVLATSPCKTSSGESFSSSIIPPTPPPVPPTYAVSFTEYVAESVPVYFFKEASWSYHVLNKVKEYSFSEHKWAQEQIYNNSVVTRAFSTDDDDSMIMCTNMTNHNYCYRQSSGAEGGFKIPYNVPIKIKEVGCYDIFPQLQKLLPRTLDKCDLYGAANYDFNVFSLTEYSFAGDLMVYWLVESGSNYPVMKQIKKLGDGSSTMNLYFSFDPKKPEDESCLQPLPDTFVYDFRNGEGDVDKCKVVPDNADNEYLNSIRLNKAIREILHLPLFGHYPVDPARLRDVELRDISSIPDEFDARTNWNECSDVIGTITDQSICGSCWAMASTGVFSDRLCISQGVKQQLSPQYMVYCGKKSQGCNGGFITTAWDELIQQGVVSESCVPFTGRQGSCPDTCKDYSPINSTNKRYPTGYVYPWGATNESRVQAIQSEIMTHGPVMAGFLYFNDFGSFFRKFPNGVYHRCKDATLDGGHYVRIIGWGTTEQGEDYWLVANSWGKSFADQGIFKIRRGINECNLEEEVGGLLV